MRDAGQLILALFLLSANPVWAKQTQHPIGHSKFPTHAEFLKLSLTQQRDFMHLNQQFFAALAKDKVFKGSASLDPALWNRFFEMVVNQAYADVHEVDPEPVPADIDEQNAAKLNTLRTHVDSAKRNVEAAERKKAKIEREIARLQGLITNVEAEPAPHDDRLRELKRNKADEERNLADANHRIDVAQNLYKARVQYFDSEAQKIHNDSVARGISEPATPPVAAATVPGPPAQNAPPPGAPTDKFTCFYAGFAIRTQACTPYSEVSLKLNGKDIIYACQGQPAGPPNERIVPDPVAADKTVLCNPLLFGLKDDKPICIGRRMDATSTCKDLANTDASLDMAIKLVKENRLEYDKLKKTYEIFCAGEGEDEIYKTLDKRKDSTLKDLLVDKSKRNLTDIAKTCDYFGTQAQGLYDRAQGTRNDVGSMPVKTPGEQ